MKSIFCFARMVIINFTILALSFALAKSPLKKRLYTQPDLKSPVVAQAEYIITSLDKSSSIQTLGVGPCVALVLHDPITKMTLMAHLDASNKALSETKRFVRIFEEMNIPSHRLQAHLAGGWSGSSWKASEQTLNETRQVLKQYKIPILFEDVATKNAPKPLTPLSNKILQLEESELYKNLIFSLREGRLGYLRQTDSEKLTVNPPLLGSETLKPHPLSLDINKSKKINKMSPMRSAR